MMRKLCTALAYTCMTIIAGTLVGVAIAGIMRLAEAIR